MSKLIRHTAGMKKEVGAALIVALQLTTLTLIGVMAPFVGGPEQSVTAPADSQITADQAQNVQAPTGTDRSDLRASAVFANKVYGPRNSQIFNLAASRAASVGQSEATNEATNEATLTSDQEDYPPYSYVYFHGTGFQPGETVNMIVVELDPVQQSFEPWDVVADENGNVATSWYISSEELIGATMQVTATGQTSGLTASATFTDSGNFSYSPTTQGLTATAGGAAVSFVQSVTAPAGNGDFTATVAVAGTGANPISSAWVSTLP